MSRHCMSQLISRSRRWRWRRRATEVFVCRGLLLGDLRIVLGRLGCIIVVSRRVLARAGDVFGVRDHFDLGSCGRRRMMKKKTKYGRSWASRRSSFGNFQCQTRDPHRQRPYPLLSQSPFTGFHNVAPRAVGLLLQRQPHPSSELER